MNNCIFISPFFKIKNNKIYLLSYEDLKIEDYVNNTYFINYNDAVLSNELIINNKIINYSSNIYLDNLLININVDIPSTKNEFIEIMYIIEQYISEINIDNISNKKNLNYYNNFYIF